MWPIIGTRHSLDRKPYTPQKLSRDADRAAVVAADLQCREACGDCRSAATGGASRAMQLISRIVGAPKDRVVALTISRQDREIGLSNHDRTGCRHACDDGCVSSRDMLSQGQIPTRRTESSGFERSFDRDRDAVQWPQTTPRAIAWPASCTLDRACSTSNVTTALSAALCRSIYSR